MRQIRIDSELRPTSQSSTRKGPFLAKPPAFQFYAKDWLSSPTRLRMNRAERGLFWDLAAIAWDSDVPGTIQTTYEALAKRAGVRCSILRKFLSKFAKSFVKLDANSTRLAVTLTQPKLAEQWANYREISEKRRKAAESRYHANAEQVQHSASASSSATAPKTKTPPLPPSKGGNGLTHDELLRDEKNYALIQWRGEDAIVIRTNGKRRLFTERQRQDLSVVGIVEYAIEKIRQWGYWCERYVPTPKDPEPRDRPV